MSDPSRTDRLSGARFPELDGLRGLAALCVVLAHYALAFQPSLLGGGARVAHFAASVWIGATPLIAPYNPELGVAIFFTLSGFVLAASVAERPLPLRALAVRRWLRLALPIFATSLLPFLLIEAGLMRAGAVAALAKSDWLAGSYAWVGSQPNALPELAWQSFVDLFARGRDLYNGALWTMPTELWGSFAIYVAYATVGRLIAAPAARIVVALLVLLLVWRTPFGGFACGAALFELRRLVVRLPGNVCLLLVLAGFVLGGFPFLLDLPGNGFYARLFIALANVTDNPVLFAHRCGAVALTAAALFSPACAAFLRLRPCRALGRISFMVYLVHVPLLCSLAAGLLLMLAPAVGYNAATALMLPPFLAVLLVVGEAATRWIDAPSLRVSRVVGAWAARPWSARVPDADAVRAS
ncbi:MAG: acyltransferase [Acetobacteraceae bacterium]|nr:acyltransferase [Acetobacteraceae bacterium]